MIFLDLYSMIIIESGFEFNFLIHLSIGQVGQKIACPRQLINTHEGCVQINPQESDCSLCSESLSSVASLLPYLKTHLRVTTDTVTMCM